MKNYRNSYQGWFVYLVLLFVLFWFSYPYLWMLLSTAKTNQEIYQPTRLFPERLELSSFYILFTEENIPFVKAFLSSFLVALVQAVLSVIITALAAYSVTQKKSFYTVLLILLSIAVIVLPRQMIAISIFEWINTLGLHGGYFAVILPGTVSGIGILFFIQIFKKIPREYMEITRIEGASGIRSFITITKMIIPALLTYGVLHFILAWNEHLLPLLLLDEKNRTLPLILTTLNDPSQRIPQSVVMAASVFTVFPVFIIFALMYRQFKSAMSDVLIH